MTRHPTWNPSVHTSVASMIRRSTSTGKSARWERGKQGNLISSRYLGDLQAVSPSQLENPSEIVLSLPPHKSSSHGESRSTMRKSTFRASWGAHAPKSIIEVWSEIKSPQPLLQWRYGLLPQENRNNPLCFHGGTKRNLPLRTNYGLLVITISKRGMCTCDSIQALLK